MAIVLTGETTSTAVKANKIMSLPTRFVEAYTGKPMASAAFSVVWERVVSGLLYEVPTQNPAVISSILRIEDLEVSGFTFPYMAGGSILRYMLQKGEWTSDFDFWFADGKALAKSETKLADYFDATAANIHSKTYQIPIGRRTVKTQVVNNIMTDILALFRDFDFTVSQFAYTGQGLIYTTEQGFADFLNRKLRLNGEPKNPTYTKTRMLKYMAMGFEPDEAAVKWLIDSKHPVIDLGKIEY